MQQVRETTRFLSVAQLADVLGVSLSTAYALAREGRIPAVRFRGCVRIPERALERWLAEREEAALAAVRGEEGGRSP